MKKGFFEVAGAIGVAVTVILVMAVLLPVTSQFVSGGTAGFNATNIAGYTGGNTIVQQYPLLIIVGLLLAITVGLGIYGRS